MGSKKEEISIQQATTSTPRRITREQAAKETTNTNINIRQQLLKELKLKKKSRASIVQPTSPSEHQSNSRNLKIISPCRGPSPEDDKSLDDF